MTALAPHDILLAAADHCDEVGLHKGELWPGAPDDLDDGAPYAEGDPCCALGHIRWAAGITHGRNVSIQEWDRSGAAAATDALEDVLADELAADPEVADWNDRPERTAPEVSSALRAAAGRAEA